MVLHAAGSGAVAAWPFLLLVLPFRAVPSAAKGVPLLTVRVPDSLEGHKELGRRMGREFKHQIAAAFRVDTLLHRIQGYANGAPLFQAMREDHAKRYPSYMAELEGMAEGSGQDLQTLLVANFRQELQYAADAAAAGPKGGQRRPTPDACTDILVGNKSRSGEWETLAFAHNEDYPPLFYDSMYLVNATFVNPSGTSYSFASVTYPGVLAGWAPSWNSHGLALSWNVLYPVLADPESPDGHLTSVTFACRDAARARTVEEAIALATPSTLRYGQNLNVGSFRERAIATVETAPGGAKSTLDVAAAPGNGSVVFHGNQYLRLHPREDPVGIVSSLHRQKRFRAMEADGLQPTFQTMHRVLGDVADRDFPIFRNGAPPDEAATLVTVQFDVLTGSVKLWRQQPSRPSPSARFWARPFAEFSFVPSAPFGATQSPEAELKILYA